MTFGPGRFGSLGSYGRMFIVKALYIDETIAM